MNNNDKEDALTLEILETIQNQSDITQRHLADTLGVALGLANSYMKRCVRKGYVKIKQVPANRYLYYLTPKGFSEKSRLTALYLSRSLDFYRRAGDSLSQIYCKCKEAKRQKILLCGVSELAEIASIRASEHDIRIIGIYDPDSRLDSFLGLSVYRELNEAEKYDYCLLTALNDTRKMLDLLRKKTGKDRILIPSILGLTD